jgi:hypothetical protein
MQGRDEAKQNISLEGWNNARGTPNEDSQEAEGWKQSAIARGDAGLARTEDPREP